MALAIEEPLRLLEGHITAVPRSSLQRDSLGGARRVVDARRTNSAFDFLLLTSLAMPILPSQACNLWSGSEIGGSPASCTSSIESELAGKRRFMRAERDVGVLPTTPNEAELFGKQKRMFHGVGRPDTIDIRRDSAAAFSKSRSEPQLSALEEAEAMPAAGCRHSRIAEIRSGGRMGKHKVRSDDAYSKSVGHTSDANAAHSNRYFVDPSVQRLGPRLLQKAPSDSSSLSEKACADHRYFKVQGEDRIPGVKQRARSARPDRQVAEVLYSGRDAKTANAQAQQPVVDVNRHAAVEQQPVVDVNRHATVEALRFCLPPSEARPGRKHAPDDLQLHGDKCEALRFSAQEDQAGKPMYGRKHAPDAVRREPAPYATDQMQKHSCGEARSGEALSERASDQSSIADSRSSYAFAPRRRRSLPARSPSELTPSDGTASYQERSCHDGHSAWVSSSTSTPRARTPKSKGSVCTPRSTRSASTPRARTPPPRQRSLPPSPSEVSCSSSSFVSAPIGKARRPGSTTSSTASHGQQWKKSLADRRAYADSVASFSTRASSERSDPEESIASEQIQKLQERIRQRVRMYQASSTSGSVTSR